MGFKSGKNNPYARLKAENERLKQELAAEKRKPYLRQFALDLGPGYNDYSGD